MKIISNKFINTLSIGMFCMGLMGATYSVNADDAMTTSMEKCYGVAKAGQNDCDAGTDPATCVKSVIDADPNYWIYVPAGLCNKLVGGTTSPGALPSMNTMPMTSPSATTTPSSSSAPSTSTKP